MFRYGTIIKMLTSQAITTVINSIFDGFFRRTILKVHFESFIYKY